MQLLTRRRSLLMGSLAATLAAPHIARAAVRTVRVGHNSVDTSQFGAACVAFAAAVAAHPDLSKVLRVEVHGNAELGDEGKMFTDCQESTIDMTAGISSVAGKVCPEIGALDIPFVFRSVERGRAAFDGSLGTEYRELLAAKQIYAMAWLENGVRHFTSNRPIRKPADLQGLKLRVPPSEVSIRSFRSFGADAKPLAYNLTFEALRTGEFDAQENPIKSIEDAHFADVQKYLCLTGHAYSTGILFASPDLIEDLSPAQQAALRSCAFQGTLKSREIAGAAAFDGIGRLKAAGMTVVDDVDTAAFVKAANANTQAFGSVFGTSRIDHLVAAGA